ncbi:uncharacterized protein TRIADDRAFT_52231 [Trichoplax adhaerens]|uniref:F-box domain-containing protein n=1 Tax=Trichoplax adhaerens TaxID=10228 RepID=B3RM44_TRIAD|nr:hypothetical protein TRIADDRAFT_52231 [Trichoplax adhaerens]EDV29633.1 hypothetical protein TRIADDRAFT_52231 [Trichoplax adhaerens]|eukprot:XP_002108835.1 hypothetical protein TRIADDRAFT_52231 [Trichoplax adhaerens]
MLNLLSDEILLMILRYLSVEDLNTCKCLSLRFANITEDTCLYRSVTFTRCYRLSTNFIVAYLNKYCHLLRCIDLSQCYWLKSTNLIPAICKCKKATQLNLAGCKISSSAMIKILENIPHLDELSWSISLDVFKNTSAQTLLRDKFAQINYLSLELHFGVASAEQFLFENSCIHSFLRQWQCCIYFKYTSEDGFCFDLQAPFFDNLITITERYHRESFRYYLWPMLSLNNSIDLPETNKIQQFNVDRILSTKPKRLLDAINKRNLKALNLSFIPTLTSQELAHAIANCRNLVKLDLSGLTSVLQDKQFQGLEAVVHNCQLLKELEISHTCVSCDNFSTLCHILSKAITLEKLTIPACLMVDKNIIKGRRNSNNDILSPQRRISVIEQSKTECQSDQNKNVDRDQVDFTLLTKHCPKIKTFSNSSHYYQSNLSTKLSNHSQYSITELPVSCSLSKYLISEEILSAIGNWKCLESLSLVGLLNVTHLSCLSTITESCKNLKRLSLAYIGLSGHSGALLHLPKAIRNCHNLLEFRFDNPQVATFNKLFDKCKHLTVLQVLHDTTIAQSKQTRNELMKKWLPQRPALVIALGKSLYELQQDTPQFHLDSITLPT